jgi:hypothetical protein
LQKKEERRKKIRMKEEGKETEREGGENERKREKEMMIERQS